MVSLTLLQWIVSAVGRPYHVLIVFYILIVCVCVLFKLEETLPFQKRYEYCEREKQGWYHHDTVLSRKVSSLVNYLEKTF